MDPEALIFDWNASETRTRDPKRVELLDDTLRDGLQNASVRQPPTAERARFLHRMAQVGVKTVNLGLPAASRAAFDECLTLMREVIEAKLPMTVACAGRTLESDLQPMLELAERTGQKFEAHTFAGSSPIRAYAEGWEPKLVRDRSVAAVRFLVRARLPVTFVIEDATRSQRDFLRTLILAVAEAGAERLCLCDTVGHSTPEGAARIVHFVREILADENQSLAIDWHGHNDRGLALANALAAFEAGVDRVHATALGVGERVGNTPLELLAMNLELQGAYSGEPAMLFEYCREAAAMLGWQIPPNYPLVGENAFRTATGVHAAAILKARERGSDIADRVYSGVPAGRFGRRQEVCIGAMSGASNVRYWLRERGLPESEELVHAILKRAKQSEQLLSDEDVLAIVRQQR